MYFEGINGIRELLNYGLERIGNGEILGFNAHSERTPQEMLESFSEYNSKLKKMNVGVRGFVPDHPSLTKYREEDEKYGRKMKVIPFDKYSSDVSIDIGPDFVKMLMFNDLQGVVVQHEGVAKSFKQIFEMMWEKN